MQKAASKDNALPIVTCHKVYYAIKTEETYAKPVYMENLTEIGVEKNYNSETFYAEGVAKYTESALSDIPITISQGDLLEKDEVAIMGHRIDNNGLVVRNINDKPATVAILFTVKKGDGIYKGYCFYDGKFVPSGISAATAEGSPNYQAKTITGNFKSNSNGDTDVSKVLTSEAEVEAFFAEVPIPEFSIM